jgi:DNA-binding MarR family transcriptional regulator
MPKDDDAREAWRCISELLFSSEQHERFHQACALVGLPHPGSLKALMGLDGEHPPSMREMSEEMRCDASYITALVDTLEELGYVERTMSPTDRRVKFVRLTEKGRDARDRAHEVMLHPPKVLDRLTASELRTVARLLGKAVDESPSQVA